MTDDTHPLWTYTAAKPSHWDDYASAIAVYPDRVEYTTGKKTPQTHTIWAEAITYVQQGIFAQKGIVSIYTVHEETYEIIAAWDKYDRLEFIAAVKGIMTQ